MASIETRVRSIVAEVTGIPQGRIEAQFDLRANADSLEIVEIVTLCEQEFSVSIDDAAMAALSTEADLVAAVEARLA